MALGCTSKAWPKVNGMSDPQFANRERGVVTVDILPVDVQVWTYRGSKYNPEALSHGLDSQIHSMLAAELGLDEEGSHPDMPGLVGVTANEFYARNFFQRWRDDLAAVED